MGEHIIGCGMEIAPGSSPYRSPAWLVGGHMQTIWPYLLPRPDVVFRRERVSVPDGDFWDFDWLDAPDATPGTPLVVLLHGLEGNSQSHYARALMVALQKQGWRGVIPHFRGCSGEINRLPRAYHSGDHDEAQAILDAIRARVDESTPIYVVGVSVGGSVLINWLGRVGRDAGSIVRATAAVSVPHDLMAAGISIDKGLNRIYVHNFLTTLKPKSLAMAQLHPGLIDPGKVRRAYTIDAFDTAVTAVLHGFADSGDYWRRASAKPWLAGVKVPTLVLNARNDPFVPHESLPGPAEVGADVLLEQPDEGGHVGFLSGAFPGNIEWLPRRLLDFFAHGR